MNDAVEKIVHIIPTTMDDLKAMAGQNKAKNLGEELLATIYSFLQRIQMIHLFPNIKKPTIPEAMIWTDPILAATMQQSAAEGPYHNVSTHILAPDSLSASSTGLYQYYSSESVQHREDDDLHSWNDGVLEAEDAQVPSRATNTEQRFKPFRVPLSQDIGDAQIAYPASVGSVSSFRNPVKRAVNTTAGTSGVASRTGKVPVAVPMSQERIDNAVDYLA